MMRLAIYGTSGLGREILSTVRAQHAAADIVMIDDQEAMQGKSVGGIPVLSFEQAAADNRLATIAIGDPAIRRRLARRCAQAGMAFFDVRARTLIIQERVSIGEGLVACDNTMIMADATIGKHFQANIYAYVSHDCLIGDHVTFAPRVCCNGNVHVGDGAYIGAGALIRQGRPDRPLLIGAGAVIGMGAVVTKDVPPGATVVGNPARPLERTGSAC